MSDTPTDTPKIDPDLLKRVTNLRSAVRENFGKAVMAMMMEPRYRSCMLGELQHFVLDPLLQDRLVFAYAGAPAAEGLEPDLAGFAIYANVSEDVDARIREQISAGVFPVRLKREDWNSGEIYWLIDLVVQDTSRAASVIANFGRVVKKDNELRLHPMISRMVDAETLKKMGARRAGQASDPADAGDASVPLQ